MLLPLLPCCVTMAAVAAPSWPAKKPVPPVEYTSPAALQAVAVSGVLKAGEVANQWAGKPKVSQAFKLAGAAADFPEIQAAWRQGDRVKAAFLLSWTMIKYGCPPADAADFAGKAVAAGMLAAKDATNRRQLDEVFASYKAASGGTGSDAWGWRQGFLSREIRADLRKKHPGFKEADFDRMERAALTTYCENRLYQERFQTYRKEVSTWLGAQGVRWSGDEAALDKFLETMDAVEALLKSRRALDGLFDKERVRLAQAIFRGGRTALDAALADYFSRYFGDARDARGEKLGGTSGRAASGDGFKASVPAGWKVAEARKGSWSAAMERVITPKQGPCGAQGVSAKVSAELKSGNVARGDMDARLRALVAGNGWYPEPGPVQDLVLGAFKGRLLVTKAKYKAGAGNPSFGYRDGKAMHFGHALLTDGTRTLAISYSVYAGSCWDNSGKAQAEREARSAEQQAQGILRSLVPGS